MARKNVMLQDSSLDTLDPQTVISQVKDANGDTVLSANPTTKRVSGVNSYKIDADALMSYPTLSDFPASGEDGKIYLAQDTNYMYRWSTSSYVQIGGGQASVTSVNSKTGAVVLEISDIINAQHKLSSDLVDDAGNTNKFVTQSEKTLWNSKVNAYEVADITALTTAQVNTLKVGDVVVKNENGNKHNYIVTYKEDEVGICLTYADAENVETVSYDYLNNEWAYNSTDITNIVATVDELVTKEWRAKVNTRFEGNDIWTDGENTYYSNYDTQKQLVNGEWVDKTWNGLTNFFGKNIWTDGDNIYYSYGETNKVLDKSTSTWSDKTWSGISTTPNGMSIWTDGENIYYSNGSFQYVLINKETSTWDTKMWHGGLYNVSGFCVWTDGENIYYSVGSNQYVLDKETSTWNAKTWNGLNDFDGRYIWTDGENIYYSYESNQYVLDKATSTWSEKTWSGLTTFDGNKVWEDNDGNIYYSDNSGQYELFILTSPIKGDLEDVKELLDEKKADKSTTYTKTETDTLLNDKVSKETGKGLSTNDYTTAEKNKLAGLSNYDDTEVRGLITTETSRATSQEQKALYHLGAYDTVSGNVITRKTGYADLDNLSWTLEQGSDYWQWKANFIQGQLFISSDEISHCVHAIYQPTNSAGIGYTNNKVYIFTDTLYVRTSNTSERPSGLLQYELATSYTDNLIENRPLNTLDQQGSQWLRKEWEKTTNLYDNNKLEYINGGYCLPLKDFIVGQTYSYTVLSSMVQVKISTNPSGVNTWQSTNATGSFVMTSAMLSLYFIINTSTGAPNNSVCMLNEGNHAYPYQAYNGEIVHGDNNIFYRSDHTYAVNQVVFYNGYLYVCIQASTGNLPTNTTYWQPLLV